MVNSRVQTPRPHVSEPRPRQKACAHGNHPAKNIKTRHASEDNAHGRQPLEQPGGSAPCLHATTEGGALALGRLNQQVREDTGQIKGQMNRTCSRACRSFCEGRAIAWAAVGTVGPEVAE